MWVSYIYLKQLTKEYNHHSNSKKPFVHKDLFCVQIFFFFFLRQIALKHRCRPHTMAFIEWPSVGRSISLQKLMENYIRLRQIDLRPAYQLEGSAAIQSTPSIVPPNLTSGPTVTRSRHVVVPSVRYRNQHFILSSIFFLSRLICFTILISIVF